MKTNRKECFYSWRVAVSKEHPTVFLIKYGRMQFIENWKKWVDGFGYGFGYKNGDIISFKPTNQTKNTLYDLWGQTHPSNWINKTEKFVVLEREKEKIVWFWESDWRNKGDRFLRCASKKGGDWEIQSPLFLGWEAAGEIIRFSIKGGELNLGNKFSKYAISVPDFNEVIKSGI